MSFKWLCLILVSALSLRGGDVVISEIMYHPAPEMPEDTGQEWIELLNKGTNVVSLSNWRLTRGLDFAFPTGTALGPGQQLVVAADVAKFLAAHPTVGAERVVGNWVGTLGNNGNTLEVIDAASNVVTSVRYASQGDWATRIRGRGERQITSLSRNGTTVTAFMFGHEYKNGDQIRVQGADQSEYNGLFTVANITTSTFTYNLSSLPEDEPTGFFICRRLTDYGYSGWSWTSLADGLGRSLELINPNLPNDQGQNWTVSPALGGSPGRPNLAARTNVAPLIADLAHHPLVPKSNDVVTISCRLLDERATGVTATVFYRPASSSVLGQFSSMVMFDDGQHGDAAAADGIFGALLPEQPNLTIIEFYVEATDAEGLRRTWPAPALDPNDSPLQQVNALYQVDNSAYAGNQPLYRFIMTEPERAELRRAHDSDSSDRAINAMMNMTYITLDGLEARCLYRVGVRNRGAGMRTHWPMSYALQFPNDLLWKGKRSIHFYSAHCGPYLAGYALSVLSGIDTDLGRAVRIRVNGLDLAQSGASMYGSYVELEAWDAVYAQEHYPQDSEGNIYRGSKYPWDARLTYLGTDPSAYQGQRGAGYYKASNQSENDWTDLMRLCAVLNTNTPDDAVYAQAVSQVVNVENWMRVLATFSLLGSGETALFTGFGDDFASYRGVKDPRFVLLGHDYDAVLGAGSGSAPYNASLFRMCPFLHNLYPGQNWNAPEPYRGDENVTVLNRFMTNAWFAPIYYKTVTELLDTTFQPAVVSRTLDRFLGDWVAANVITTMKIYATNRCNYARSRIPLGLQVTDAPTVVSGYPRSTSPIAALGGVANAIETRSVLVNGSPAEWTAWRAAWRHSEVALQPGLNRVLVQTFGTNPAVELDRQVFTVWYDDASVTDVSGAIAADTTWTVAEGPYRLTSSLTIENDATLTIEPGTTVYLNSGASLNVASGGRLLAEGSETAPVVFCRVPGNTARWGGITVRGAAGSPETRITHAFIEGNSGTAIHSTDGTVFLDHVTFGTTDRQYLSLDNSSFVVQDCVFPATTSSFEPVHGTGGIKAGGRGLFLRNFFGPITGYNDTIDFSGGHRPGPIVQFIDNVFMGSGDDNLDLDNTDAWVEGNLFLHVHKNGSPDTSSAISAGSDTGESSDITIVGNIVYDCDQAAMVKQGGFYTLMNNTIVRQTHAGGLDTEGAVVCLADNNMAEGAGMYLEGNVIWEAEALVRNRTNALVTFTNNLMPLAWSGPGGNNSTNDPLFQYLPSLAETTNFTTWAQAQVMKQWFGLRPGSPARVAGPNGVDQGALVEPGVSLSGAPVGTNNLSTATLAVGVNRTGSGITTERWPAGAGYTHYQWRLDGGDWSVETPLSTPIALSGLANGPHYVEAVGRRDSGGYQNDPALGSSARITRTRTWFVDADYAPPAPAPLVRINEILAANQGAVDHEETQPDIIELHNAGTAEADLSGVGVTDDPARPHRFVLPDGTRLAPGAYLVLYADIPNATSGIHLGFNLNKEGDSVYLFDSAVRGGRRLDGVSFGLQVADLSLGRLDDGSWALALPTFGAANQPLPLGQPQALRINEWLANGAAGQADFVELYNPASLPVSLEGLYLTDNPIGWPLRHPIAPLSFIPAHGVAFFLADRDTNAGANHLSFRLSGDRGAIALLDSQPLLIDQVLYGPQTLGVSEGRRPSGSDTIGFFPAPTPGSPNPGAGSAITVSNIFVNLVSWTDTWRYDVSGTDLGTAWREPAYDDSSWPNGEGIFYQGDGASGFVAPINTYLPISLPLNRSTFYFRTSFILNTNPAGFNLVVSHQIDDGAVYWLNGVELYRHNMPGGAIGYANWAGSTVSGNPSLLGPITVPASSLQQGVNVLAVELHQANSGSSDIALGTSLDLLRSITNYPTLPLVINEIMANNVTTTNADGTVTDWVELYNPSETSADLSDMSLSDDTTDPRRFVFPPGVVMGPRSHLLVRCDASAPASTNNTAPLNTGFGLAANGDQIWLFDTPAQGLAPVDGLAFGLQAADFSLGRAPDGGVQWTLNLPTAGAPNIAASMGEVSQLRINEWMADPANGDDWFELYNPNSQPTDLSGCFLTDSLSRRTQYRIPPHSYIGLGGWAFARFWADNQPARGADHVNFRLAREGESLGLFSPSEQMIDGLHFGLQANGVSQGRLPDGAASVVSFPESSSPESPNYLTLPQIFISEALPQPDSPFEDAIELFNQGAAAVEIGGWWLSNSRHDLRRFRIPDGAVLLPDGFAVFYRWQFDPDFTTRLPGFTLDRLNGDQVFLSQVDALGELTGYRAAADFGPAEKGVPFGRHETSVGADFTALSAQTFGIGAPASLAEFRTGLGAPNASPKVGPVVINEIMYHPPDLLTNDNVRDEYIELLNVTGAPVALFDPARPANTWHLRDGVDFDFPTNVTLPAGGFLLLVSFDPSTNAAQVEAFRALYEVPPAVPVLGPYGGRLGNDGNDLDLRRPDPDAPAGQAGYILVDRVRYLDDAPWPEAADRGTNSPGVALQRRAAGEYGNDPVNWTAGLPTPGRANGPAVVAPPAITALTPSQLVNRGESVELAASVTGAAPLSWQWRLNGVVLPGATNSTLTLSDIQLADAGRYTVLVCNRAGAASAGSRVDLIVPPEIVRGPENRFVAEGGPAFFTVDVVGSSPLSYRWYKDATLLPDATSATLRIPAVDPSHEGAYFVVVTNRYGAVTSGLATLLIQTPPFISLQPTGTNLFLGETAFLGVQAGGSEPLGYQWRLNGAPIPGATHPSLTVSNVQPADAGNYTVLVSNAVTALLSAPALVTVTPPATVTVAASIPTALEQGPNPGAFRFTRSGSSNLPLTVQFDLGGTALPGTHYQALSNSVVIPAGSNSVVLAVTPIDDAVKEADRTVLLNLVASRGCVVGSPSNALVTILDNDNARPIISILSPANGAVVTGPTNVQITVLALDTDGTVARVEYFANATNKLGETAAGGSSQSLVWSNVQRGAYILTAAAYDNLGARSVSGPVNFTVTSPQTGFADLFIERASLFGFTNTLRGTNSAFTRETGEPRHNGKLGSRSGWISWTAPAQGFCVLDTFGSSFDTVLAVYTNAATPLHLTNLVEVASNDDAASSNLQSRLSFLASAGVTYQIAVDGYAAGEGGTVLFRLELTEADPWIVAHPQSRSIPEGGSVTFGVSAAGSGAPAIQWLFNDAPLSDQTNSSLVLSSVQPGDAGAYRASVSNHKGTVLSREAFLTILPAGAIVLLDEPGSQSLRSGVTATLAVNAQGVAPLRYRWQLYGTNLPGATNASLVLTNIDLMDSGPYQVIVTNAQGAVTSSPAILAVDEDLNFQVVDFRVSRALSIDTDSLTSYYYNGIGVSTSRVFVIGYDGTASYDAATLASGSSASASPYYAMVCNLKTERVYAAGLGSSMLGYGGGTMDSLIELNPSSGQPTGTRINLSRSLYLGSGSGLFSGWDRVVIWSGNDYHVYNIALPGGQVTDLGYQNWFSRNYGNGWSFFGLAEYAGGSLRLVYVQDQSTIARIRVGANNGEPSPVSLFTNLGYGAASIGFSPARSRWYFRTAGSSQFGNNYAALNSAKAVFAQGPDLPTLYLEPESQLTYADSNVTFRVLASGREPLSYQWQFNGEDIDGATQPFLTVSNALPSDSGDYTVVVSNRVAAVASAPANLYVVSLPEILYQPQPRSVISGSNTTFYLTFRAAPPYWVQWQFNGVDIPGATNQSLTLSHISRLDEGLYSVIIGNRFGQIASSNAVLALVPDSGFTFRIRSLDRRATLVEHQSLTGGEGGSLAVGAQAVIYNGSAGAARFRADDLSGAAALGREYPALVSDLRSERVYSLMAGTNLFDPDTGSSTVDSLVEIDPATGIVTPNRIPLTQSFYAGYNVGVFAGYGQIVILSSSHAYSVSLPSGVVEDLGYVPMPSHPYSPTRNFFWGVAENFGGSVHLVYAQSSNSIVRTRVPDGLTTSVANYVNLANMCSLSASVPRGRWYFHYGGQAEFGGTNQTVGFCAAEFEIAESQNVDRFAWAPIGPVQTLNQPIAVSVSALTVLGRPSLAFSGPATVTAFDADTGAKLGLSPVALQGFSNGVWSGSVTVTQAADRVFLRVEDAAAHLGDSGVFSVAAPNDLLVRLSVQPAPGTVLESVACTMIVSNTGPGQATAVRLDSPLPAGAGFVSAAVSQGAWIITNSALVCDLGTLGAGASATVVLTLRPGATGSLTNSAVVTRAETDSRPDNNSATVVTPVTPLWLSIDDVTVLEGNSGYTRLDFSVTLSAAADVPVWVAFSTTNGSAVDLGDFQKRSGLLYFPPGITSVSTNLNVIGEAFFEPDETFGVVLHHATNAVIGKTLGLMTILNDDPAPRLNILDAAFTEGNAGAKTVWVRLELTQPSSVPVSVSFATADGTAIAGRDYVATNGTVTFPANGDSLSLYFTVLGNTQGEPDKTFTVNLVAPVNTTLLRSQATVTLLNDDSLGDVHHFDWADIPNPQLLNTPFPVTVTARNYLGEPATNFNGRANFTGMGGGGLQNLVIGTGSTMWDFPLATWYEDGRCSSIYLASELGGARRIYGLALNVTGLPGQTLNSWHIRMKHTSLSSFTGSEDWDNAGWTVVYQNNEQITATGWVNFAFSAPFDYNGSANLLVDFSFNNSSYTSYGYVAATTYPQTRTLYYRCDSCGPDDPLQWTRNNAYINSAPQVPDIRLLLGGALAISPATSGFFNAGVWNGTLRVLEPAQDCLILAADTNQHSGSSGLFDVLPANDLVLSVTPAANPASVGQAFSWNVTVSNSGPTTFTGVRLTNRYPANVPLLDWASDRGTVSNVASTHLVSQIGALQAGETATLTFSVHATNALTLTNRASVTRNETEFYTVNNFATNTVEVRTLGLTVSDVSLKEGDSGTTNALFNVSLSAMSTQVVSVAWFTSNGTARADADYAAGSGVLVFAPGVTNLPVVISVVGDLLNETNETFHLCLANPTNAPLTRAQATATILNDDPLPILTIGDVTVAEGNAGYTTVLLRLALSSPSDQRVTVFFNTADGAARAGIDYVYTNGIAAFPPGESALTLPVLVVADTVPKTDRAFFLRLTGPAGATLGSVESRITILNDDGAAGLANRFSWSLVSSPQTRGQPFQVTLTARDAQGNVASNFNTPVALRAIAPGSLLSSTILEGMSFSTSEGSDLTLGYSFIPSSTLIVTHFRHYSGSKVSLWTDDGGLIVSKDVSGTAGVWTETALDNPVVLTAGVLYRLCVYSGGQPFYFSESGPGEFAHGLLVSGYYAVGDAFPAQNVDPLRHFGVDLRYSAASPSGALAMTPGESGAFSNGVWSGEIAILQTATNVQLVAEGGQATGSSVRFDVIYHESDAGVTATVWPEPAVAGQNVALSLLVYNRGPDDALAVTVTNWLPAGLAVVNATTTQGEWTDFGPWQRFTLGTLSNRAHARIVITAQASFPVGDTNLSVLLTNASLVAHKSVDSLPLNNAKLAVFELLADTDQDGAPDNWELAAGLNRFDPRDAALDADGDGLSNLLEYRTGTDALDPARVVRILGAQVRGADLRLSFHTVIGRTYELQVTADPRAHPVVWAPVQSGIAGVDSTVTLVHAGAAQQPGLYYRVIATP